MQPKEGKDFHLPVLPGMISESVAFHRADKGLGRIVFARLEYTGQQLYGVFYIDAKHGPYEVVPVRSLGFKSLTTLGHVERFLKGKGRNEIPELLEFEDIKKTPTTKIET